MKFAENRDGENRINRRVAKAFEGDAPASLAAVAERYGALLNEADGQWAKLLQARSQVAAKQKDAPPPAESPTLTDPDLEAIRLLLYAAESPANLPEPELEQFVYDRWRNVYDTYGYEKEYRA